MRYRVRCALYHFFFFQAEDGIRDLTVTGVQTCALPIWTYVGGIQVSGKATVTLLPGVYYLQGGGLSVSGQATVTGSAVLIYNAPTSPGEIGRASCRERV